MGEGGTNPADRCGWRREHLHVLPRPWRSPCHAIYGEHECKIQIDVVRIIEGRLPPAVLRDVIQWLEIRKQPLLDNWTRATNAQPLQKVP